MILGFLSPDWANTLTLAKDVAQLITSRYPPVIANNPERTVSQARIAQILKEAFASVPQLHQEKSLGLIGRARFGSAFKWELREIGYEEEFIDLATRKLVERLIHHVE